MTEITKLVMIGLIGALVIGVFIGFVVNEAYGEGPLTIEGATNTHGIFISMEGTENIIMWDTEDGYSEHFDGKLKTYNSGGFSLKNPESGIAVWGHPVGDGTWRLVILTAPLREGSGVVRMTGNTVVMNDITTVNSTTSNSTTIEPKSSIGSDITRYDIPTTTGRSGEGSEHIYTIYSQRLNSLYLGDIYDQTFKVYDAKTNTNLEDISVKLEIIRDGFVYKTIEKDTGNGGLVRMELGDLEYPLFYPNFCYDVNVTAMVGNDTLTWEDDFAMIYSGSWNPDMDWISESRWDYLPSKFQDEPRPTILADEKCN